MKNVFRLWFYFRTGYSGYLSLALGLVQFLLVGALYIERIPEFAGIHLTLLALIFMVPFAGVCIGVGVLHTHHQMSTDAMLSALQNPYLFRISPGKEERLMVPMSILQLKVQKRFIERMDIMTPELEEDFKRIEETLARLASGEDIR